LQFDEPRYIDDGRAGGEPMVATHPDGTVLVGTHAGTTHVYAPAAVDPNSAAFIENYRGQTYFYFSGDEGKTFSYVNRLPVSNAPLSGFSDPDIAIDTAGNVFISEINLVNVALSESTDHGRSYSLNNLIAETFTDRQWSEADQPGVVYLVGNPSGGGSGLSSIGHSGHWLYKTKDSGATFPIQLEDDGGLGDLRVDKADGTLYEANYADGVLSMGAFRGARNDDMKRELGTIATGVDELSHWPAFDIDRDGNLYVTWDESGHGKAKRAAGVYYSYSVDRGHTWSPAERVDPDNRTDIWPWLAVGEPGKVAIAWFEADKHLPDDNAETTGTYGWRVAVAHTFSGLGCTPTGARSASLIGGPVLQPVFSAVTAIKDALHNGTVCMNGTVCEATQTDRRLGDYFSVAIDGAGHLDAVYTDTRQGGIVGLPAFLHQSGGPTFGAPAIVTGYGTTRAAVPAAAAAPAPAPVVAGASTQKPAVNGAQKHRLPATGGGGGWAVAALASLAGALGLRAVRRPARR